MTPQDLTEVNALVKQLKDVLWRKKYSFGALSLSNGRLHLSEGSEYDKMTDTFWPKIHKLIDDDLEVQTQLLISQLRALGFDATGVVSE